jgi:hypothetical protein
MFPASQSPVFLSLCFKERAWTVGEGHRSLGSNGTAGHKFAFSVVRQQRAAMNGGIGASEKAAASQ